jgi:hypothetical protein
MGVFLRWGIFGILAVAALVYAYNSSKSLAQRNAATPPAAVATPTPQVESVAAEPAPTAAPEPGDDVPETCRIELDIARRAVEARSIGEPLDRVLRIQEIAWQEDVKRRERLTQVATRWYSQTGTVDAVRLRREVVEDCGAARS